jgi:hypothetical protein
MRTRFYDGRTGCLAGCVIADLLGHSTTPGETRNIKVTRGYAHGVPQRLGDAADSLEEGKRLVSATPSGAGRVSDEKRVSPLGG